MATPSPGEAAPHASPGEAAARVGAPTLEEPPTKMPRCQRGMPSFDPSAVADSEGLERADPIVLATRKMLDGMVCDDREELKARLLSMGVVPVASGCSGSNVATVCCELACVHIGAGGVYDVYACEKDEAKQLFLMAVEKSLKATRREECAGEGTGMHVYADVADLGGLNAKCVAHGGRCTVPDGNRGPLLEFWGFSCKNFSRMFNCENKGDLLMHILKEGKGSSGETFQSMLRSMREHPVFAAIIENTEDLISEKHLQDLVDGFDSIGMVVATDKFSSVEFGVPQRRVRVFGVALNVAMCNLPKQQARALANRM
ncbi:unnamed protein product, partial [Prorocentrum cordatum]